MKRWQRNFVKYGLFASVMAAILVAIFIWQTTPQETYQYVTKGDWKTKIPNDIAATKDCKKYQEFVHSLYAPGFTPDDTCPWPWDKVNSIADFSLNGIKFRIPREYLFISKSAPDGVSEFISMRFKYPDMTPVVDNLQANSVNVKIRSNKNSLCHVREDCKKSAEYFYQNDLKQARERLGELKARESLDNELSKYNFGNGKDYYVQGNLDSPVYWLICSPYPKESASKMNPACVSAYSPNDKYYVEYRFRRRELFENHKDIRKKVIDTVSQLQLMQMS